MVLTERQKLILDKIIEEHIDSAKPVSSQLLEKKHNFEISPATIRNEMQELTNKGYLYQPHTSAGRVPTDKSYRLFVDNLLQEGLPGFNEKLSEEIYEIEKEIKDSLKFIQALTKRMAHLSSNLAVSYFPEEDIFWKEGWDEIFKEPEFKDEKYLLRFVEMVKNCEENIADFSDSFQGLRVYIGRENPIPKSRDFSIVASKCKLLDEERAILAILGPKRMPYPKNVSLISSLTKMLEEF